jgi:outer membrane protein assembly factor BamB
MYDLERTGANPLEQTISPANVSQLREEWSVPTNGSDFSAPIVANGTVYFGSWNGYEYAVDAVTGTVDWQTFLGTDDCGGFDPQGISSTATYLNGTLYLGGGGGSASGENSSWFALNATNGTVDWSYQVDNNTTNAYNWASALAYQNSLYIGVSSCFDNPLVPGGVRQVNLTGNHTASHVFDTSPPGEVGESIWSSPSLDPTTNTLWITTGNEDPSEGYPPYANALIALNASNLDVDGSWQIPSSYQGSDSDFGTTPCIFTTPSGMTEVIASNKDGYAYAFNASNVSTDGSWGPIWSLLTGGGWGGAVYDGSTLYLSGNAVTAVNPLTGNVSWSTIVPGGYILGSLTWANGIIYAGVGPNIAALDATNGTILWNATLPGGQVTVSEPVVADGRLYVASGNYGSNGSLTSYGLPLSLSANADTRNGTAPLPVSFSATAQGGLPPYTYSWQFGDGNTSSARSCDQTYPVGGNYTVLATVTDAAAETANLSLLVSVRASYPVTFTTVGLPSGTDWWLNLTDGQSFGVGSSVFSFDEPNGSYGYTVRPDNLTITGSSGAFVVDGGPVTVPAKFPLVAFTTIFAETGLSSRTPWSVTVNGVTETSLGSAVTFDEPNGSYAYTIGTVPGWVESSLPYRGEISVSGSPAIEPTLRFGRAAYTVGFAESGAPVGTEWWVNLTGGASFSSTSTALSFAEPNGSYDYSVGVADKRFMPSTPGAPLRVNGSSINGTVSFYPVTFGLTFTAAGLPDGANWSLTLMGGPTAIVLGSPTGDGPVLVTRSSGGSPIIQFSVSNGSYSYTAQGPGRPSVYGNLTVHGPIGPPFVVTFPGIPSPWDQVGSFAGLLSGVGLAGCVMATMLLLIRRRLKPPSATGPPDRGVGLRGGPRTPFESGGR